MSVAPFEIIGAPFTMFVGPVGTPMPAIDDEEADFDAGWVKLGTSGDKNYDEDGVSVKISEKIEVFRSAGSTVPRKAFRTEEDLMVGLKLADLTPDQFAQIMDDATITTTAAGVGVAGNKAFSLYRGPDVAQFAVLLRGPSSVVDGMYSQFEVDSAFQSADQEPTFTKGKPALLAVEFTAIDAAGDGDDRRLRIGTAPAT